jgi:MFS family permease
MTSGEGREQSRTVAFFRRVLDELGLVSLYKSTSDVKLLCLQRFVRLFAYGASTLVLVAFLRELHISQARIGLFMTLTLAGDVCISFILALFADRLGRRAVIFTGAVLMCGSGLVFALVDNYWVLLLAAVLGVISPSGNEIGPFRAVEESIIAHVTDPTHRSDVYAWYSLSGNGGTAFGMMVCGWVILALRRSHDTTLEVYRYIFYGYAALGLAKAAMVLMLSSAVEAEDRPRNTTSIPGNSNGETQPLLSNEAETDSRLASKKKPWLPQLSKESRTTVFTLCTLFMLDAFASGLAPLYVLRG